MRRGVTMLDPERTYIDTTVQLEGEGSHHGAQLIWFDELNDLIDRHKMTLIFCNTRSLAELIFQDLWAVNEKALPIGIHHGSLALEARRKVEAAMAAGRLRGLVATASLDLGIDWGDIDLVHRTVSISRAVVGGTDGLVVKDTKTHAARVVSLPSWTYWNEPSGFSVNEEACAGPLTRTADSAGPSGSVSLTSTPGAAKLIVPPSATL